VDFSRLVGDNHLVSSELSPQRVQKLSNAAGDAVDALESAQMIQRRLPSLPPPPVSLQLSKLRSRVSVQGGTDESSTSLQC
jgi:hypothetical protein